MSALAVRVFCGIVVALCLASPSIAADCGAAATTREGRIMDTGHTFATFSVRAKPCAEGCSGTVEYWMHYLGKNRTKSFYSGLAEWRSEKGEPVEISDEGYNTMCKITKEQSPCTVIGTEIKKVSCYHD